MHVDLVIRSVHLINMCLLWSKRDRFQSDVLWREDTTSDIIAPMQDMVSGCKLCLPIVSPNNHLRVGRQVYAQQYITRVRLKSSSTTELMHVCVEESILHASAEQISGRVVSITRSRCGAHRLDHITRCNSH